MAEPVSLRDVPSTIVELVAGPGSTLPGVSLKRTWDPGAGATAGSPVLSYGHLAIGLYVALLEPFFVKSLHRVRDGIRDDTRFFLVLGAKY